MHSVSRVNEIPDLLFRMHVQNKKYMYVNFVPISCLTGEAQHKNLKTCSSSLWICLHHMVY